METKTVYKVSGNDYSTWQAPVNEVVVRPFTEVAPPKTEDELIIGFDWTTNAWLTVKQVSVNEYNQLTQALFDLANRVSELEKGGAK